MNKIVKLTYNELIKQYKKISVVVITVLLFVIAAAAPFLFKILSDLNQNLYVASDFDFERQQLDSLKSAFSSLSDEELREEYNISPAAAKTFVSLCDPVAKITQTAEETNVTSYDDWRYGILQDFLNRSVQNVYLKAVIDGADMADVAEASNYMFFDTFDRSEYESRSKEELQTLYQQGEAAAQAMLKQIVNNDHRGYTQTRLTQMRDALSQANATLKTMQQQFDTTGGVTEADLQNAEADVLSKQAQLELIQLRYDKDVDYEPDNWKHRALTDAEDAIPDMLTPTMEETDFNNSEMVFYYRTYDNYTASIEAVRAQAKENYEVAKYSVAQDLPQPKHQSGVRSGAVQTNPYIILVSVFAVLIAGGIVSSEYGKGTIRLLLIRPVSRNKILLSKLLAVCVICLVTFLGCFLLTTTSNGILYGFSDLFVPILSFRDGIVQTPFALWMLLRTLQGMSMLIFVIAVSFTASTLFRNTAVAEVLGVAGCFLFFPLFLLFNLTAERFPWLIKTPLPYLNIPYLQGNGENDLLGELNYMFFYQTDLTLGALEVVGLSAILILIAFIVFRRHDVKN